MAQIEICKTKKFNGADLNFAYELLKERMTSTVINISHTKMPTWEEHVDHLINNNQYKDYFFIKENGVRVGICYITNKNEIGIFISRVHQKKGIGVKALQYIIHFYGDKNLYANINPLNVVSQKVFENLGAELIQYTYIIKPDKVRRAKYASLYKRRNGYTWQGNNKATIDERSLRKDCNIQQRRSKTSGNGKHIPRISQKHHALYDWGREEQKPSNAIDVRV